MKTFYYGNQNADTVLIQLVGEHDLPLMEREYACLREMLASKSVQGKAAATEGRNAPAREFLLAVVLVDNWNEELSPWTAPPVFGNESFGAGAEKTLAWLEKELLPNLQEEPFVRKLIPESQTDSLSEELIPELQENPNHNGCDQKGKIFYIGGYSLAGLFALWATCQTDAFHGAAAVSPSAWFPGFKEYIKEHPPKARSIYLSLGDKEEKTRNRVMAQVGSAIKEIYELLKEGNVTCTLEWNAGNHFAEPEVRTAKGWAWLLNH